MLAPLDAAAAAVVLSCLEAPDSFREARPQESKALEAAWRKAGFAFGVPPPQAAKSAAAGEQQA